MATDNNIVTVVITDPQTKRQVYTSSLTNFRGSGFYGFQDTQFDGGNKLLINEDIQTKLTFTNPAFVKDNRPQVGATFYDMYDFDNQLIITHPQFEDGIYRVRLQFVAESINSATGQGVRVSLYSPSQGFSLDRNTVALIKGAGVPQRVREVFTFYSDELTDDGLEIRITPLNGNVRVYNANLLITANM
jgi:hypothetical protein